MKLFAIESWLLLIYFDFILKFRGFRKFHGVVQQAKVRLRLEAASSSDLCRAVDIACVFYFKPVLCLQRSAATTVLLRRYGWAAEMVIGAQTIPFQSHAWVEVSKAVVNDKPYMPEIYQVLERC